MYLLFESLQSFHFLPLLLLVLLLQACFFLPDPKLPFEMFFVPLSADRFRRGGPLPSRS
jgi:hypothetical protein